MFEKVSQIAEQAATNVSRRQFLGRFGKGALMLAAALGATLALPGVAHAGRNCCPRGTHCRRPAKRCRLAYCEPGRNEDSVRCWWACKDGIDRISYCQ
jgi:hypothetical protein